MTKVAYTLFNTSIGHCALAWNERGLVGVQLPEANAAATLRRLRRRHPGAVRGQPSAAVRRAIAAITRLLGGGGDELGGIELDYSGLGAFRRRIYALARAIPPGATLGYGELAARAGSPGAARAVGQAMARNPFPLVVPCHRVLAARGGLGGFSARGGVGTKLRLLRIEGAPAQAPLPFG